MAATVAVAFGYAYGAAMDDTHDSFDPAFLDGGRPDVPDIAVPRGVTPFYLPLRPVRGRLVRLGPLADALLTRHDQHPAVTRLVGQAMALVAALATALKFTGSFSLQIKGDGPVRMLLADCTDTGALRGYASVTADRLAALTESGAMPTDHQMLGDGYLAFTVDQGPDMDRHQGIVSMTGDSLEHMALHYFDTSEQTPCFLRLTCAETPQGWRAAALILERVAGQGGVDPDMDQMAQDESWGTALILAATVKDRELLDDTLSADRLLYNLFNTEGVAADRPRPLSYGCRCSRSRLVDLLATFGADDIDHMETDGTIVMTCEFCNHNFTFTRDDIPQAPASAV
jgi:molecular chaperone Hsp33